MNPLSQISRNCRKYLKACNIDSQFQIRNLKHKLLSFSCKARDGKYFQLGSHCHSYSALQKAALDNR